MGDWGRKRRFVFAQQTGFESIEIVSQKERYLFAAFCAGNRLVFTAKFSQV